MIQSRATLAGLIVATGVIAFGAGTLAQGRFPEINRAENALRNALEDLQRARDMFGGHKGAAERLINQALGELQAAKGFAMQRGGGGFPGPGMPPGPGYPLPPR